MRFALFWCIAYLSGIYAHWHVSCYARMRAYTYWICLVSRVIGISYHADSDKQLDCFQNYTDTLVISHRTD
jgi:hypothetical protein